MTMEMQELIERSKDPVNQGTIENPTLKLKDSNPICGDEIELFVKIENNEIKDIKHQGAGCAISKVSTDILADYVLNKTTEEVLEITNEEILQQIGVTISAMRLKCALLSIVALKKAIKSIKMTLEIKNLKVNIEDKQILKGVNLVAEKGKVTVLMGRNGSGKSTLANTLMGHPRYEVTDGNILFKNEELKELKPDERAKKGLFLSFQYPQEVTGVSLKNFLRTAYNSLKKTKIGFLDFKNLLDEKLKLLDMDESLINRSVNEGFSGGEKKRSEILQLAVLQPSFAILDETDSGLDIESLRIVAEGVNKIRETSDMGILLITHYNRILKYIKADKVCIMVDGKIVKEGSQELVEEIENKGYEDFQEIKIE